MLGAFPNSHTERHLTFARRRSCKRRRMNERVAKALSLALKAAKEERAELDGQIEAMEAVLKRLGGTKHGPGRPAGSKSKKQTARRPTFGEGEWQQEEDTLVDPGAAEGGCRTHA